MKETFQNFIIVQDMSKIISFSKFKNKNRSSACNLPTPAARAVSPSRLLSESTCEVASDAKRGPTEPLNRCPCDHVRHYQGP